MKKYNFKNITLLTLLITVSLYTAYMVYNSVKICNLQYDIYVEKHIVKTEEYYIEYAAADSRQDNSFQTVIPNIMYGTNRYFIPKSYKHNQRVGGECKQFGAYLRIYPNMGTNIKCDIRVEGNAVNVHYTGVGVRENGQKDEINKSVSVEFEAKTLTLKQ